MYFQANEGYFSLYTEVHQKALNLSPSSESRHLWGYSIAWSSIRALGQPFFSKEKKAWGKKRTFVLSAHSAREINGCKSARDESSNLSNPIAGNRRLHGGLESSPYSRTLGRPAGAKFNKVR